MADVWDTKSWEDRHFAEGLGFWEVNVYLALIYWHPEYNGTQGTKLTHIHFRILLAHALLTLGKVKFGETPAEAGGAGPSQTHHCTLVHFKTLPDGGKNEGHNCAYCGSKAYYYCKTCFPDGGTTITAACCSTAGGGTNGKCFAQHVANERPKHFMRRLLKKRPAEATRQSPRRVAPQPNTDTAGGGSAPRRRL